MIDKVIKLGNGLEYYVLDQIEEKNKKYIFAIQIDNDKEETTDNYIICELVGDINGEKLVDIADDKEFEDISNKFLKRMEEKDK